MDDASRTSWATGGTSATADGVASARVRTAWHRILGPGILMAAAAIGVSHLVQSTRAGADFGYQLLWLVIAANMLKWPFFEFGQRYGAATGETMLHGYRRLGRAYVAAFLAVSFVTMLLSIAALTFVTAGLAANLVGGADSAINGWLGDAAALVWAVVAVLICEAILFFGRYRTLDRVTKGIIAVLGLTAMVAVVAAMTEPTPRVEGFEPPSPWTAASFGFLVALMGWMPAPVELSAWPSVWMVEREQQTGYRPTVREARFDFNTGYIGAIVLAGVFLALGALMMYGTGQTFSSSGVGFSAELVALFTDSIGPWIGPVVATAAFTCIFSTTLTCLDGYPRSNAVAAALTFDALRDRQRSVYWTFNILAAVVAVIVVWRFLGSLTTMVDLVTTVAFLTAPVFAFINLRLITSEHTPAEHRPGAAMLALSWLGLLSMIGVGAGYVVVLVQARLGG